MKTIASLAAASLVALTSTHALAADPAGLSFPALEYNQPRDRLMPSNQSSDIVHHTPADRLSSATARIDAALPAGTPRAAAEAVLGQAGARCRPQDGTSETCSFFTVETRDEYVDAVHWDVRLALAGDRVSGVAVDRHWVRS